MRIHTSVIDRLSTLDPVTLLADLDGRIAHLAAMMEGVKESAGSFTCAEVEAIASVLRLAGYGDSADVLVHDHGIRDDDPDDDHHHVWHEEASSADDCECEGVPAEDQCDECEEEATNFWPELKKPVQLCDSCEHNARRSGWEPGQ